MARICIVTEELPGVARTGGIGAAMHELALVLSKAGHSIDLLYYNVSGADEESLERAKERYAQSRVRLMVLDWRRFVDAAPTPRAISFAIYRTLSSVAYVYDCVHFPDFKGFAFYSLLAKNQGLAFNSTNFVVQVHGPTRWTIEANNSFFTQEEQLAIDYMETRSIEIADSVVAPSQYIADWVNQQLLKTPREISVIRNLCGEIQSQISWDRPAKMDHSTKTPLKEIVVFGRHEDRKGIDIACQALSRISNDLVDSQIFVSFIGGMGMIAGQSSLIYIHEASKKWDFQFSFHFGLNRNQVAAYISGRDDVLVVVPSPYENSPFTVHEPLTLGVPLLLSLHGGAKELIDERDRDEVSCTMNVQSLATKLREKLVTGVRAARFAQDNESVAEQWRQFHLPSLEVVQAKSGTAARPLVTVGITHFERPAKLFDAVLSIIRQDYDNIELIGCEDGSTSEEATAALSHLEVILSRAGGRLLRRENGYLGAARNTILADATGEYVIFLDDDDIAATNMVSTLVGAALHCQADVVSCLNYYMPENTRGDVLVNLRVDNRVCYFPLGGPLSLSAEQNVFGSATALFRREAVLRVGGYSEVYGVGHEDYELYIKLAIHGCRIEVCPEPLFFYEVGRPSMVSATSLIRNFNRCFKPLAENMPQEMVDYVNLSAGRNASANQSGRTYWLNDQKPTRQLRHNLMSGNLSLERCLEVAAQLADEEGNSQAAAAFRAGLMLKDALVRQGINAAQLALPRIGPKPYRALKRWKEGGKLGKNLVEARFLFALDRGVDALHYLEDYVSANGINADAFLVISENVERFSALKGDPRYQAILAQLKEACIGGHFADVGAGALVAVLIGSEMLARDVLDAVIQTDGQDYMRSYGDVAQAVSAGQTDPFQHFVEFGAGERRSGFSRTIQAYSILRSNAKWKDLVHRGLTPEFAAAEME